MINDIVLKNVSPDERHILRQLHDKNKLKIKDESKSGWFESDEFPHLYFQDGEIIGFKDICYNEEFYPPLEFTKYPEMKFNDFVKEFN